MQLVLSLFHGVDLFGRGFENKGFSVVRGCDILFGTDITDFHIPSGRFDGIIGGSPCQDFSKLRRTPPTGEGLRLLGEFCRVVTEGSPMWFCLENVPSVPDVVIEGYHVQRFDLSPSECGGVQSRRRHFQFGHKLGYVLNIKRDPFTGKKERCAVASEGKQQDRRTWEDFCELQGLPRSFDLPPFTLSEKYKAVGNGVNVKVAERVAQAICDLSGMDKPRVFTDVNLCACGCGAILRGKQKASSPKCRKRIEKRRRETSPTFAPG